MESLLILLGLLLLAIPVFAIVALVKSIGLGDQVRRLDARLAAIERRMAAPAAEPATAQPPRASPPQPAAPVAEPPAPAAPARPSMSLEERLGTQWAVWVGGIAVALGGIFLVRHSYRLGLIGPGVQIFLGALLAAALIVAGEWARRTDRLAGMVSLPTAHIPSILTAAGTTVAYADVYAAYAIYNFLAPGVAFILLGLVALATLAAALLHGPAL